MARNNSSNVVVGFSMPSRWPPGLNLLEQFETPSQQSGARKHVVPERENMWWPKRETHPSAEAKLWRIKKCSVRKKTWCTKMVFEKIRGRARGKLVVFEKNSTKMWCSKIGRAPFRAPLEHLVSDTGDEPQWVTAVGLHMWPSLSCSLSGTTFFSGTTFSRTFSL